jgi:hypothetical protein
MQDGRMSLQDHLLMRGYACEPAVPPLSRAGRRYRLGHKSRYQDSWLAGQLGTRTHHSHPPLRRQPIQLPTTAPILSLERLVHATRP